MKWASDERRLAQACSAVLAFMHRHPISATWGRSDLASSDMMSMETSQRVFVARNDPRRLTPSVGIYSHTRDSKAWCAMNDGRPPSWLSTRTVTQTSPWPSPAVWVSICVHASRN